MFVASIIQKPLRMGIKPTVDSYLFAPENSVIRDFWIKLCCHSTSTKLDVSFRQPMY